MYKESEYLLLSGLQHLRFCPRQCAFIHLEQQWSENFFTADGHVVHEKVHSGLSESRKYVRTERNLKIASSLLGITGQTDAVDFFSDGTVIPIEYKHGSEKEGTCDLVQLCAQAICLEEMLKVHITYGSIFYFKTHKKIKIEISDELRNETIELSKSFHELIEQGKTPLADYSQKCESCSFIDTCFPKSAGRNKSVNNYINIRINQKLSEDEDL